MKATDYETVAYPITVFLIQNWATIVLGRALKNQELEDFVQRLETDFEGYIEDALAQSLEEFVSDNNIKKIEN